MGIAITAHPVGTQVHHLLQGLEEVGLCLVRQAVDQAQADGLEAGLAGVAADVPHQLQRVDPADGALDRGIEVLDAEAYAL